MLNKFLAKEMSTNLDTTFHLKCEYHTVPDIDADYAFADVNDIVAVDDYFVHADVIPW